jgi:hypothetical protein
MVRKKPRRRKPPSGRRSPIIKSRHPRNIDQNNASQPRVAHPPRRHLVAAPAISRLLKPAGVALASPRLSILREPLLYAARAPRALHEIRASEKSGAYHCATLRRIKNRRNLKAAAEGDATHSPKKRPQRLGNNWGRLRVMPPTTGHSHGRHEPITTHMAHRSDRAYTAKGVATLTRPHQP